jgi:hypothetical protein
LLSVQGDPDNEGDEYDDADIGDDLGADVRLGTREDPQ